MTKICAVCGSEIPNKEYWDTGSVLITWFGGDEAFGTKGCISGSTISHRRWPWVCKSCMAKVVDVLEGKS